MSSILSVLAVVVLAEVALFLALWWRDDRTAARELAQLEARLAPYKGWHIDPCMAQWYEQMHRQSGAPLTDADGARAVAAVQAMFGRVPDA